MRDHVTWKTSLTNRHMYNNPLKADLYGIIPMHGPNNYYDHDLGNSTNITNCMIISSISGTQTSIARHNTTSVSVVISLRFSTHIIFFLFNPTCLIWLNSAYFLWYCFTRILMYYFMIETFNSSNSEVTHSWTPSLGRVS